jgi:hypothetical protein
MTEPPTRPPALWLAIVRALVPAARRDEVEGDLIEGWDDRSRQSRWRRTWAFWRDAWSVAAHRRFGAATAKGRLREPRDGGGTLVSRLQSFVAASLHDVRSTARLLRRRPGFCGLAIATLAIGMGAATAVFTIADRVLLRPLPFPEPGQIVAIEGVAGMPIHRQRAPELDRLRELVALGTYQTGALNLGNPGGAVRVHAASVGARFFDVLGVRPIAGRTIAAADDPADLVAVIAFDAWHWLFGGSPSLVGGTIRLNSRAYTVVGVMPRGFRFPDDTDVWIPALADRQAAGSGLIITAPSVLARLAPGTTLPEAVAALTRADDARRAATSGPARRRPIAVLPLQAQLASGHRPVGATIAVRAWVDETSSQARIMTVGTDGSGYRDLHGPFAGGGWADLLRWTPDGQSILFTTGGPEQGGWRMARIPASGGSTEFEGLERARFASAVPAPVNISSFDVSPDGSRVAFSSRNQTIYELWTLDNLLNVLNAR